MTIQAPFAEFRTTVSPEWVDHNGHMGIRSYTKVFDQAVHAFYRHLGITREALEADNGTIFALQESGWFRREVMLGDPLLVVSQLIDIDHNKLVTFNRMEQTRDGYVAALNEIIEIHIDKETRRPAPFGAGIAGRLAEVFVVHRELPRPPESGRGIAIPRKTV
jgi:acyl-CoA thioester hydrolase